MYKYITVATFVEPRGRSFRVKLHVYKYMIELLIINYHISHHRVELIHVMSSRHKENNVLFAF
jgi:hypothetical protein